MNLRPEKNTVQEFLEDVGAIAHVLPKDLQELAATLSEFLSAFGIDDFWGTQEAQSGLDELCRGLEIEVRGGRLAFEEEQAPQPPPLPKKAEKTYEPRHRAPVDKPAQPIPTPALLPQWRPIEQVARTMAQNFASDALEARFGSVRAFAGLVAERLERMGTPFSFSTIYNVVQLLGYADLVWAGKGETPGVAAVRALYPDGISEQRIIAKHGSVNALAALLGRQFGRSAAWGHQIIRKAMIRQAMEI